MVALLTASCGPTRSPREQMAICTRAARSCGGHGSGPLGGIRGPLLHAGQLSEAAQIAARMVTVTDGRDLAAATAMRLVLARAAVMTAAWEDARVRLADVGRSRPADQEALAEAAVIEAQVALGDGRAGSEHGLSIFPLQQRASPGTPAGLTWPARRWRYSGPAPGCTNPTRRRPPSAGLSASRPRRSCGCTASGSSTSSGP